MASESNNARALPKFGEWDVNDPASAEGYTVIFSKAGDQKKTNAAAAAAKATSGRKQQSNSPKGPIRKCFCFA
ncbi:hypothetical protein HS088_TW13G00995 [Tripterygium wilfordii]|uniref:RIN4 pathogenic type III effector avirulence factor Avr cleavage site domain-containing protein n=1 Tax=Tripterygium wilfordii TaxID=458696 RepID=A0A7J7CVH1_TRIWF|nr:hypothetical protein HS088_TW13G00995 [Tripterygium wilfordii]